MQEPAVPDRDDAVAPVADTRADTHAEKQAETQADTPTDAVALAQAQLAAWHVQGAQRADPVRFAVIEAMARRAARHDGAARAVIDARLNGLVAHYGALLRAQGLPPDPVAAGPGEPAPRGPLGRLVDALTAPVDGAAPVAPHAAARPVAAPAARARPAGSGGRQSAKAPGKAEPAALPEIDLETVALHTAATPLAALELQAVRRFRGTWSRLSAQERLRQTLAQVPPQAGPLNALHLLHRALVQMQDLSPDYLQHFVAHVDALLWLEQVHSAALAPAAARSGSSARAIAARRKPPTRGR